MKQVNNRQKMFVKPKRDVQKFVVAAGRARMTESRKAQESSEVRRKAKRTR